MFLIGHPGSRKTGFTFTEVERALTIGLIAVDKLETCTKDECPDQVRKRVGTLPNSRQGESPFDVVGEEGICGLANAADLANPIVGAAICARVLKFETRLNQWIETRFGDSDEWEQRLAIVPVEDIRKRYDGAVRKRIEPGMRWMYGTISDKMTILGVDAETREADQRPAKRGVSHEAAVRGPGSPERLGKDGKKTGTAAQVTGFGRRDPPPALCSVSGAGSWGIEGAEPLARPFVMLLHRVSRSRPPTVSGASPGRPRSGCEARKPLQNGVLGPYLGVR